MKMLETKLIRVNPHARDLSALQQAADALRRGELVVFPTDTVYGIGASVMRPDACAQIFEVKERPADKPLIIMLATPDDVDGYATDISESAKILMHTYWPGPLTLVLKRNTSIPDVVTANGNTVGLRCPDNVVARELIRLTGAALATTSANMSDSPSPVTAQEAVGQLQGRVPFIIDGGKTRLAIESTVIDISGAKPRLLREGYIAWADIMRTLEASM